MSNKTLDEILEKTDNVTRLAVAAWVFSHIVEHAEQGGSFRYLIYDRLGFGLDAYVPLYEAGGMTISNKFDIQRMETIKKIAKDNQYEKLKPILGLCDQSECYKEIACGWPDQDGNYRTTCGEHYKGKLSNGI
jgi:hypothetical protein